MMIKTLIISLVTIVLFCYTEGGAVQGQNNGIGGKLWPPGFPEVVIFDPKTNETIKAPYVEYLYGSLKAEGEPEGGEGGNTEGGQQEQEGGGWPCSCQERTCGCCFGMKIDRFNFSQESKFFKKKI